jgi:hypothetical protein
MRIKRRGAALPPDDRRRSLLARAAARFFVAGAIVFAWSALLMPVSAANGNCIKITDSFRTAQTHQGSDFFVKHVTLPYGSGPVRLAGDCVDPDPFKVDDGLKVDVSHRDGSKSSFSHDFSNGCGGTINTAGAFDLTKDFRPGKNQVTVHFQDLCGQGDAGTWAVFLQYTPDTKQPTCTIATKRNQKLIKRVKKGNKKVLKRTPFGVGVTQNEDGHVFASASGKTDAGDPISLKPADHSATAGNGVAMKLALEQISEKRIIDEVKKDHVPRVTLIGTCQDLVGNISHASAIIRFHDSKQGKAFKFPLIADSTAH